MNAMHTHLNKLKLFNYTRAQDNNNLSENNNEINACENNWNESKEVSVSNLLKENSKFLKNIGQKY